LDRCHAVPSSSCFSRFRTRGSRERGFFKQPSQLVHRDRPELPRALEPAIAVVHGLLQSSDLLLSRTVLTLRKVCRFHFHFTEGDDVGAQDDADVITTGGRRQPVTQVLPCLSEVRVFMKTLYRLSGRRVKPRYALQRAETWRRVREDSRAWLHCRSGCPSVPRRDRSGCRPERGVAMSRTVRSRAPVVFLLIVLLGLPILAGEQTKAPAPARSLLTSWQALTETRARPCQAWRRTPPGSWRRVARMILVPDSILWARSLRARKRYTEGVETSPARFTIPTADP
jgi:hypothetical protein